MGIKISIQTERNRKVKNWNRVSDVCVTTANHLIWIIGVHGEERNEKKKISKGEIDNNFSKILKDFVKLYEFL